MRKKIVAGNWKMNLNSSSAISLSEEISTMKYLCDELIIFPPLIYLSEIKKAFPLLSLGAQNGFYEEKGAFTGEVSFIQLKELGLTHVLIGHSERRQLFKETNLIVKQKVDAAISAGLIVVFCCGEPFEVREMGDEFKYVDAQLEESLFHLSEEHINNVAIAYEPIWAIGTGLTATSNQAESMHSFIRQSITIKYSSQIASDISILYGGSCNAKNAKELFSSDNIDGGLIGGASLVAEDFLVIANSF